MLLNDNARRVGIYVFFDKDGIVDDYVIYFLKEIRKFISHLLVVINGSIVTTSYQKLLSVSDEILIRENNGYDIAGYKAGIDHLTWQKIATHDECIFMNSTNFGPFYSFNEMFLEMNKKDIDFWGITKCHMSEYTFKGCKYNYTPEHIQSSFLVVRKSMGSQKKYQDVWNKLPVITGYEDAIGLFELPFTKESIEKGFKCDVYIDTSDLEGVTRYPLMMLADELIINRRCPVMKQKSFSQWYFDVLDESLGVATQNVLEYLFKHIDYDVNLIWDNILRTCNMSDIKNHLKLNTILPKDYIIPCKATVKKVALIMHLYYQDQIDIMFKYAESMLENSYFILITPNKELKPLIKEKIKKITNSYEIIVMENRGRDVSALLVAAYPKVFDFDYVCFVHDKKSDYIKPFNNGRSFFYSCMENLLSTKEYVVNILATFDENEKLGMIMPPIPCHGDYYQVLSSEWAGDYELTVKLAKDLDLRVNIDGLKPPITPLGTMFWFRPKALKTLFEKKWKYIDFPEEPNGTDATLLHAIERIYGFVCQNDGYYSVWGMTTTFAGAYMHNLYFMLREVNLKMFRYFYPRHIFDMINRFDSYVACSGNNQNLIFQISLKTQIRLRLKKYLPKWVYGCIVRIKRLIWGPHMKYRYNENDIEG